MQQNLYFNTCYPAFNRDDDTAEALLCDFRGGKGVQELLNDFLLEKQSTPLMNGFSPPERLALAGKVAERSLTEKIEEELSRILETDHL